MLKKKKTLGLDMRKPVPSPLSSQSASSKFVNLFPVWTVLWAGAGLLKPDLFAWLTTEYFTAGLALLMVSMGITLTPKDFKDVLDNPQR